VNGAHDLGGMHGFGPVELEPGEPVFHGDWERRAFALTLAAGYLGRWNIDESRAARERMAPVAYLASTYYEHWLFGLEELLEAKGLATRAELKARIARHAAGSKSASLAPALSLDEGEGEGEPRSRRSPPAGLRALPAAEVEAALRRTGSSKLDIPVPPRFRAGDAVVARNINPPGHTRLPRYARGKRGEVALDHGVWVFPDASGNGLGPRPQHCYSVRFAARELWGDAAHAADAVHVDLWDDHLEPAP
jgi:nitrile hydratase beta subunit